MASLIRHNLVLLLFIVAPFPLGQEANGATAAPSQEHLKSMVTIMSRARSRIAADYLERNGQINSSSREGRDMQLFLGYLDGRILYYCQTLHALAGTAALEGLPCPSAAGRTAGNSPPGTITQTHDEKIAVLETDLEKSLGEFDDMLLMEQKKIQNTVQKQREKNPSDRMGNKDSMSAQGGSSPDNGRASGENGSRDEITSPDGRLPSSSPNDNSAGAGLGEQKHRLPTAGNRKLADTGDDVVARQLKEAAEQEKDPEIKAHLWEEYRKYKEGIK